MTTNDQIPLFQSVEDFSLVTSKDELVKDQFYMICKDRSPTIPIANITHDVLEDVPTVDNECCTNGKCIPGCSMMGGNNTSDFYVCKYDGEYDRSTSRVKENVFCFVKLWKCLREPLIWEKTKGKACYRDILFFTNSQPSNSYKMNIYTLGKNHNYQKQIDQALTAMISPNNIRKIQQDKDIEGLKMVADAKNIQLPADITRYASQFLATNPEKHFRKMGSKYIRSYKKGNYKSKDSRKNSIPGKNRRSLLRRKTNKNLYNQSH